MTAGSEVRSPAQVRFAYDAFISYSHAADGQLAPALQSTLEKIAKPWYRLRALHLFRDTTDLSVAPELWSRIQEKLAQSRTFLLLASPTAAKSKWVRKEVDWWLANRSAQDLLIVLTDGALVWSEEGQDFDWAKTTALPDSLSHQFTEEPQHGDFTWAKSAEHSTFDSPRFRDSALGIAATLRGVTKGELDGEAVRTLRRNRQWAIAAVTTVLLLLVLALDYLALSRETQWHAEQATLQSQRTLANALASAGAEARAAGDTAAAIRLVAEARRAALTPLVEANVLAMREPLAQLKYVLPAPLESRAIVFAPRRPVLVLGQYDGTIVVVDALTGKERARLRASELPIIQMTFSAVGDKLYALARRPAYAAWNLYAGDDPRSELIEIDTKDFVDLALTRRIGTRGKQARHFESLAMEPASGLLIVGTTSDVVRGRFEDIATAPPVIPRAGTYPFATAAVSPDGKYVVGTNILGTIRILPLVAGEARSHTQRSSRGTSAYSTFELSFDPHRPRAFFGAPDGNAYVWWYTKEAAPQSLGLAHPGGVSFARMSADGQWLATSGWDGLVRLARASELCVVAACVPDLAGADLLSNNPQSERLPLLRSEMTSGVSALAFSADSTLLAATQIVPVSSGVDPGRWMFGRVHVWALAAAKQPIDDLVKRQESIRSTISYDAEGHLFSLVGQDSPHISREGSSEFIAIKPVLRTPALASQLEQELVARVLYGHVGGEVYGTTFRRISLPIEMLLECAPAPRQARIACITANGVDAGSEGPLKNPALLIHGFGSETERRIPLPFEQIAGAASVAWSPDASRVALALFMPLPRSVSGLERGPVRAFVVEAGSGSIREVKSPHIGKLQTLAWHPNGESLAIYDELGGVGLVEMDGRETWLSNDNRVESSARAALIFADRGNTLIAASESRLRRWQLIEGEWQEREMTVGIEFKPTAVALSPDERLLIIGDDRGRLAFRELPGLDVIATQQGDGTAVVELAVSPDGARLAVLSQRGLTELGTFVPETSAIAERMTNWALVDGRLVPLDESTRMAAAGAGNESRTKFDSAAADLWTILARGTAFERRSVTRIGWLIGREPVQASVPLQKWMDEHASHPLAPVVGTLAPQ